MRRAIPASPDTKSDETIVLWNFPDHISFQQMGQCHSLQLCRTSTLFFYCICLHSAIIREVNGAMYSVIWLSLADARVREKKQGKKINEKKWQHLCFIVMLQRGLVGGLCSVAQSFPMIEFCETSICPLKRDIWILSVIAPDNRPFQSLLKYD